MSGGYDIILNNLKQFSGSGLIVLLFAASLFFLYVRRRKEKDKDILVLYPIAMLAVYFCPIWILYALKRSDFEILYRVLWLVPMGLVISAALVELVNMIPKEKKLLGVLLSLFIIALSGKYIYSNSQFTKAQNVYHIPQNVVDICRTIETPGREVKACFPDEMLQYVRQYDPYIHLAYGREVFLSGTNQGLSQLRNLLMDEKLDSMALAEELRNEKTPYLVISGDREINPPLEDYDFDRIATVGEYDIYLDKHANVSLSFEN